MSKKLKVIIISLFAVGLLAFIAYNYVMHGGARDLDSEEASFTVTSSEITQEFTSNTDLATKKYQEKAVVISGIVTSTSASEVTIDNSIICNLKNPDTTIKKDQKITVKGRVVGYDDLMSELKLDQSLIIKN